MPTIARIVLVLLVVWLVLSMAFETTFGAVLAFQIGPITIGAFDVLLLAAGVLLVREATLSRTKGIPAGNRTVLALVFGYCAYQIAVVLPVAVMFHGLDPVAIGRQLENRVSLILIPFVYLVGLRYMSARRLVWWINVAAIFLACFAMYKYATEGALGGESSAGVFRLRELWGGATLLFGFLILTSLFLRRPNALSFVMAVIGLIGLGLTNHRSGYIALFLTVPPLVINSRRMATRALTIVLVLASVTVLLFVVSPKIRDSVYYSLQTMDNPSADETAVDRVNRSRLGWDYFVANPLGDYQWNQQYYLVNVGLDNFEPHNFVIQLLGQQGIIAFALFAGLIGATARVAWRNRREDRLSAVMLAYLAFYLIFCLFNTNLLNIENVMLLIFPTALILDRNGTLLEKAKGAADSTTDAGRESLSNVTGSLLA